MSDQWLNDVTVKFEDGYSGRPAVTVEEKQGKDGPYKMYAFSASFADASGQVKKHKTKSFKAPGPVGTTMTGSIKLYHGNGSNGPYTSYTFYPDEGQEAKQVAETAVVTANAPAPATSSIPFEARRMAVRFAMDDAFAFTKEFCERNKWPTTPEGKMELFKCSIMSLKIDGCTFADHLAAARNIISERDGMPKDDEVPEPEKKEEPKIEEKAKPDDLEDCPF